jgi:phosphoserine aminotransferase
VEAGKFCTINEVWPSNTKAQKYQQIPDESEWKIDSNGAYFHFCSNETIHGVEVQDNFPWHLIPQGMKVVCDMSSNICSKPVDWTHYDVVYAGAQKNMGPSGTTVLIIKEELIG